MRTSLLLAVAALASCHRTPPAVGPSVEVRLASLGVPRAALQSTVAVPLERACGRVPHVSRLRAATQNGLSRVTVQFDPGTDLTAALSSVQASVRDAAPMLPPSANAPQVTPGVGPVVARYSWSSEVLSAAKVDALVHSAIVTPLSQKSGVGRIAMCGAAPEETRIEIDPGALAATSFTVKDVVAAVQAWKPYPPAVVGGGLSNARIGVVNGTPLRIADVATFVDGGSRRGCLAYDERGLVEEETVYAYPTADKSAVRKTVDDAFAVGTQALPAGVDHRVLDANHEITIDLVPNLAFPILAQLREAVRRVAGVGHFVIEIGEPGDADGLPPTTAHLFLATTDDALVSRVISELAPVPIVRKLGEANATVELQGPDRDALDAASAALFQKLTERGDLVSPLGVGESLVVSTVVDDDAVRKLSIAREDVDLALSVMDGREVSTNFVDNGATPTVIALRPSSAGPDSLGHLYVKSATGSMVPLAAVAKFVTERVAPTLFDEGQFPMVGARVRTKDVEGLMRAFTPPVGVVMRVYSD